MPQKTSPKDLKQLHNIQGDFHYYCFDDMHQAAQQWQIIENRLLILGHNDTPVILDIGYTEDKFQLECLLPVHVHGYFLGSDDLEENWSLFQDNLPENVKGVSVSVSGYDVSLSGISTDHPLSVIAPEAEILWAEGVRNLERLDTSAISLHLVNCDIMDLKAPRVLAANIIDCPNLQGRDNGHHILSKDSVALTGSLAIYDRENKIFVCGGISGSRDMFKTLARENFMDQNMRYNSFIKDVERLEQGIEVEGYRLYRQNKPAQPTVITRYDV